MTLKVRVRTSGLRSGFAQDVEPGPQLGYGSYQTHEPNPNIRSGSGADPVRQVHEPDHGQYPKLLTKVDFSGL